MKEVIIKSDKGNFKGVVSNKNYYKSNIDKGLDIEVYSDLAFILECLNRYMKIIA